MHPITEREARASFVNCTKGEASRLRFPDGLESQPWDEMDFLGWVDPRAPQQACIVAPTPDGVIGVRLRRNTGGGAGTRMCSLCNTVHPSSGVGLMVAARAGKAGRDGNSVGIDLCSDLRCSGYVRGWAPLPAISRIEETGSVEDRAARLQRNLATFLRRVLR